jgi:hypothetical protein
VVLPGDLRGALVELIGVGGREGGERPEHAQGAAQVQAGAHARLQVCRGERDAAVAALDVLVAEACKLLGDDLLGAARGGGVHAGRDGRAWAHDALAAL